MLEDLMIRLQLEEILGPTPQNILMRFSWFFAFVFREIRRAF